MTGGGGGIFFSRKTPYERALVELKTPCEIVGRAFQRDGQSDKTHPVDKKKGGEFLFSLVRRLLATG